MRIVSALVCMSLISSLQALDILSSIRKTKRTTPEYTTVVHVNFLRNGKAVITNCPAQKAISYSSLDTWPPRESAPNGTQMTQENDCLVYSHKPEKPRICCCSLQ